MTPLAEISPLASATPKLEQASSTHGVAVAGRFEAMLDRVEQAEKQMGAQLTDLATGEIGNLHQFMLNMEEIRMQFELFVQIRNRALEAYQEIMRMQV